MRSKSGTAAASSLLLCSLGQVIFGGPLLGQERTNLHRQLTQIFETREYEPKAFGPARWLDEGASYTTVEASESADGAKDIVLYETSSGRRKILLAASRLVPEGDTAALEIDDYAWSKDRKFLLIFTNTKRVWRRHTRGDSWVLDLKG